MKNCCFCVLIFVIIGFVIWYVRYHFESIEKEKLENKQKKSQKLKLEKEINDLEIEKELKKAKLKISIMPLKI
jgi:large-conductance mechanosensitive channel